MQVSIILPYYNASQYIFEVVESILNQTLTDWELLIINDCSTEKQTSKVLSKILNLDKRICILSTNKNSGAGVARNIGIRNSQGRFLAFCDADDWWYPTKLEEQVQFMLRHHYEFTCTYYENADAGLNVMSEVKLPYKMSKKDLLYGCNIGTPGVVIDTQRIGKFYMPNLRGAEDWGYWLIILTKVSSLYAYPKVLWKYRHIKGSTSSNKFRQLQSVINMYISVLEYSRIKAILIFLFFFLPRNIIKKIR